MLTDKQYAFLLKIEHGMRNGQGRWPEDRDPGNLFRWSYDRRYHRFRDDDYTRYLTDLGRAAMRDYEEKRKKG